MTTLLIWVGYSSITAGLYLPPHTLVYLMISLTIKMYYMSVSNESTFSCRANYTNNNVSLGL